MTAVTFEGAMIGVAGGTQVLGVEGSVGVQHFRVTEGDGRAPCPAHPETHLPYHVLPQIKNPTRVKGVDVMNVDRTIPPGPNIPNDQEFVNELWLIGQQVAFGELTVDEAAEALQALIERLAVK